MKKDLKLSYPHPPINFDKVWFHLHRLGAPIYMDTYFKAWTFKQSGKYVPDYYPGVVKFDDLYLFFKHGEFYGKYNIKLFGYVMFDYFLNKKHFTEYLDHKNEVKKDIESLWKKRSREDIQKLSSKEQLKLIDESLLLMMKGFMADPIAPMVGEIAVDYTTWWLTQKGVPESEQRQAMHLLFASDQISETILRQIQSKKRLDAVSNEHEKKKVLSQLEQELAFARTEYSGWLPFTEEDILKEYDAVSKMQFNTEQENKEKQALLEKLGANEQEKWIFYLFGYCQYSRDERKEYLQKMMAIADWALLELSVAYKIDINWLRTALVGELSLEKLEDKTYIALLKKRYEEGILMYWKDLSEGEYIMGNKGEDIYKSIDSKIDEKMKELKGQSTYYGKVTGPIKIISDPKMPVPIEPFILLTGMTSPDFIHFMQKSIAILTDEGGITSHAAILSRELKKPCIVGIKYGRKFLKDGDIVEVDAERGIIKILS